MSARAWVAGVAAVAGLASAPPARAQGVSDELAAILARAALPSQDSVGVVQDALPPTWSTRLPLPAGGRFVGAVLGRSAATAYVVSGASPAGARGLARAAALAAGFVEPPPQPPMVRGGLEPQRPAAVERPLCRGGLEQLRIRTRAQGTATLVTVAYRAGPSFECSPPVRQPERNPWAVLPPLQPPPLPTGGAPGLCRSFSSSAGSGAEVVSALDLAGVLRSYGRQLEGAGWTRLPGDSSVAGTWTRVAATDTATATLVVSGPAASGCRHLQLELRQNRVTR